MKHTLNLLKYIYYFCQIVFSMQDKKMNTKINYATIVLYIVLIQKNYTLDDELS